jgi:hypothetical protein
MHRPSRSTAREEPRFTIVAVSDAYAREAAAQIGLYWLVLNEPSPLRG